MRGLFRKNEGFGPLYVSSLADYLAQREALLSKPLWKVREMSRQNRGFKVRSAR